MDTQLNIREQIRSYYNDVLSGTDDLRTNACSCANEAPPRYVLDVLREIDEDIIAHFYGCGSPIPPALEGATTMDLGCGTGRDVFICAKLVGPDGHVIGVDMTPSQLEFARSHTAVQLERFGAPVGKIDFIEGFIEDLADIADESIDLITSNCVMNLSPFKEQLFAEVFRVLKPGGELYFSDVFSDRRVPEELMSDPVLAGECIAGAMYLPDLERMLRACGVNVLLIVDEHEMEVGDIAMATKLGCAGFKSCTVRAIKCHDLELTEEDYQQTATYLGTMPENSRYFDWSSEIRFIKGKPVAISGNTAKMLAASRYARHFEITPPRMHVGPFDFEKANEALRIKTRRSPIGLDELEELCGKRGIEPFSQHVHDKGFLQTTELHTMQVNMGYKCNLACNHCYIECGPARKELMSRETMEQVLAAFAAGTFKTMDITGGAPEMNPELPWFIEQASAIADEVIVRSNLCILDQPGYGHLAEVYKANKVKLVASLPYFEELGCDGQRGSGTFRRIIEALRRLNEMGYGIDPELQVDLVYNIDGPFLPPDQGELAEYYRYELERNEHVRFNGLYAMSNFALGRFARRLANERKLGYYLGLLADNYNGAVVASMMCRTQVSVNWDGSLRDCEANHALCTGFDGPAHVSDIAAAPLGERTVVTTPICYTCAAGHGTSCGGSLMEKYAQ
ncbi:MAG: arsenosugar biosynthesis radical SAM (seleno)protein ArsS [Coriobacteriales bacterium]|jgi:arsenite methyltransferase